nr:hypothetical protein [Butyrivibrio sp.]
NEGDLETRKDNEEPLGIFAHNEVISNAISNMKLTPVQEIVMYRNYFLVWIALTIIWLIIATGIYHVLVSANRMFYSYILMEAVLAIVVGSGIIFMVSQYHNARSDEHTRFGIISLQGLSDDTGITSSVDYKDTDFYDSSVYQDIQKSMADFVQRNGNSSIFYDVFIADMATGKVVASASGRNNESAVFIFGNAAYETIEELYSGKYMYADTDMTLSGQKCKIVGIVETDFTPGYALMGVINDVNVSSKFRVSNWRYIVLYLLIFAIGSAVLTVIYFVRSNDFRKLEYALKETALGRSLPERPRTIGADIKNMWDSLTEINKRVDKINYTKIKVLEAYYRFAPKNIEHALGKETIIDVKNGSRVDLSGSLLTIRTIPEDDDMDMTSSMPGIETMVEKIESRQQEKDCIIVGNNSDLSKIQMLFLNSQKSMVDFAAELIHDSNINNQGFNSAFIFYDDFEFGIVGNSGLAFTYISSGLTREISKYGSFFQSLHLGLVITEYVKLRAYSDKSVRFIGYIILPGMSDKINLYEVMDACKQEERQKKLRTIRQFEKAFDMYEQKDFYLARNLFSDLLKEAPDDELSRWYLFESEKYLNEGVANEITFGSLHL